MIIAGILLFFAILIWDLITDYKKWLKQRTINHDKEGWIRGALLVPSIFCFAYAAYSEWWSLIAPALMVMFWYWLLFDGIYGLSRRESFWFTGTEDGPFDARSDNFLQHLKLWQHICIKIGGILLSTSAYILSLVL